MTDHDTRFTSLPDKEQIRILINNHNSMVFKTRLLTYELVGLKVENDNLSRRLSQGTEYELKRMYNENVTKDQRIKRLYTIIGDCLRRKDNKEMELMKLFLEESGLYDEYLDWVEGLEKEIILNVNTSGL